MKAYYRKLYDGGIGGWNCPCCKPKQGTKPLERRLARRKLKEELMKELE